MIAIDLFAGAGGFSTADPRTDAERKLLCDECFPASQPPAPPGTTQEQPLKVTDLPAIGQPLDAGLFAGITTRPDGTHCAVVLLADKPSDGVTWKQAIAWAKKLDAELPARPVSALLFANLNAQFDPAWYWTCESYDSSYAWDQNFSYGGQDSYGKSYAGRARAVRLIQLTA